MVAPASGSSPFQPTEMLAAVPAGAPASDLGAVIEQETADLNLATSLHLTASTADTTGEAASLAFPEAGSSGGSRSLTAYAPRAGAHTVSDDSMLVSVRSLSISNVHASAERLQFTVQAAGKGLGKSFDRTVSIDIKRTGNGNEVMANCGALGHFRANVTYNRYGSMVITPQQEQGMGGVVSITIGRGGNPVKVCLDTGMSTATVTARPA